jgi:hypothetical protein
MFYEEKELLQELVTREVTIDELGRTDTYDEKKLLEKIKKLSAEETVLLYKIALQVAIVGAGNKNYGYVIVDGKEVDLVALFSRFNIKYGNQENTKLNSDDFTPRRIVRIFRYHIRKFIETTGKQSYLWAKYADKHNKRNSNICFPGAEYLVKSREEALFLLNTYKNVDDMHKTQFSKKMNTVFVARNIINIDDNMVSLV